ncbi:MAG: hypothetical protein ACM3S4_05080 [Burkholderiales bacterium]
MRWRKQKKRLLDHPYFDCNPDVVLSRKETEQIYNSGFPTFEEMVDGAKKRFDIPLDAWSDFDKVIALRSIKSHRENNNGFIVRHKRLAIALVAILLVISFFTLIPFGRALAADFFNMIMRVLEGRIEISSENPDYDKYEYVNLTAEQYNMDNEGGSDSVDVNSPIFYPNIEDFVSKTGYIPVTISADWLKCQTIQSFSNEEQGLTLTIQYLTSDGFLVVLTQRWNTGQNIVFQIEDATYNKVKIFGNTELLYAIDPVDGSFNGTAVLSDSLLLIGAEKGVDVEKLLEILK